MAKFKLGINNCFAVKRWPEPEEWLRIVKKDLGLDVLQFSLDLLDPRTTEPARSIQAQKIKDGAEKYKVKIQSTFTGGIGYHMNLLLHPDFEMRVDALDWFQNAVVVSEKISAESMGGIIGAFSMVDYADEKKKSFIITELKYVLHSLASMAKIAGLKYLLIEPSPVPREVPSTIDEAIRLYEFFNDGAPLPIMYLVDLGHACSYMSKGDDLDPYAWLKKVANLCPVIHLQQTDGKFDRHWSFTEVNNKNGIIDARRVIDAINESGAKDDVYLIFELIHAFEARESDVLDDLKKSVEYWEKALS